MSRNKDWNGSLSLEWYVILPTGKTLGLDCLTAWCSWQTDFSYFSFSRFFSFFSDSLSFSLGMRCLGLCFYKEDWYEDSQTVGQKYTKKKKKKKRLSNGVPCGFFKIKLYMCQILKRSFFLTCQHLIKSFCFYILY